MGIEHIAGIYNYGIIPMWAVYMYRLPANVSRVGIVKRERRKEFIGELSKSGYVRDSVTRGSVIDLLA